MIRLSVVPPERINPISSPWGNYLPLTDPFGRLTREAYSIVLGFMYFPSDPVTAWSFVQANALLAHDPKQADFPGDTPQVARWIESAVTKAERQWKIAITVGAILLGSAAKDGPISQRQAIFLTQQIIDCSGETLGKKFPRDEKNIRKAFERFKPSIHLLLAMLTLSKKEWLALASDDAALLRFLSIAGQIQAVLAAKCKLERWLPWAIHPQFLDANAILNIEGLTEKAEGLLLNYRADPGRSGWG